jgi:transposase
VIGSWSNKYNVKFRVILGTLSLEMKHDAFNMIPKANDKVCNGKSLISPRSKILLMSKSHIKKILITCFDIKGIDDSGFISRGQTVNRSYYVEILMRSREAVRRKRPELWSNDWILHHDNAPAHKAFSVKQFLAQKSITRMEHSPCSPDLAPNGFWLFPKIKSALKGRRFQDTEDIQKM